MDSLLDPHLVLAAIRDEDGHITDFRLDDANDAACRYFAADRERLLEQTVLTRFPGAVGLIPIYSQVVDDGVPIVRDDAGYQDHATGAQLYFDIRGVQFGHRMLFAFRDVTERHESARRLADSEERYRLLAENAWDVIWTMELDGSISYVSPSVERVRGITPAEAMVQSPEEIQPPDTIAKGRAYYEELFTAIADGTEPPTYHGEQEYYRKDGTIMLGEVHVIPQVDADGNVARILGVTRDISDRRRYEEELNRLAVTDPLTGVWNRRQGQMLFAADLAEAGRHPPTMTMLMLDIDHFKVINDTFGHQTGDRILVELTSRLAANLRPSDVLVRWGGEEFIVVMRHCTEADGLGVAEKIRARVADVPFEQAGWVTISVGVAGLQPTDDLETWVDRADRAMYAAKAGGRNAVRASHGAISE